MSNRVLKARFKFKSSMPLALELTLQNKYGFEFFSHNRQEGWLIYLKYSDDTDNGVIDFSDLPETTINELTRCVNRVAGCFADPDKHKEVIKKRCTNMARTMGPKERAWVLDWIKRVIDEEEDRWVIDADQLKQEVQGKLL